MPQGGKRGLALPDMELNNISLKMNKLARHWASYDSHLGWTRIERSPASPVKPTEILSQKRIARQADKEGKPYTTTVSMGLDKSA